MERIVITGLGSISPLGENTDALWQALVAHDSKPQAHERNGFSAHTLKNRLFYPVARPEAQRSATTALALAAAREAMAHAGFEDVGAMTIGVGVGTGAGDCDVAESARIASTSNQPSSGHDIPYGVAERIALELHCEGPTFNLSNACSASLYACAHAVELLQSGCADAVLVIGAESVGRITQASMERMSALDPEYCRPFDQLRSGTMLGEGAAALVLEPESSALRRGARIYGVIAGYATNCDAHHPTAPREDGAAAEEAARQALARAGLDAAAIDVIIPHGTGTPLNDRTEGAMLRRVFGSALDAIPVCPIKSKLGHGGGAAGAFSLLTSLLIMREGSIPPIFNRQHFAPDCDLQFVWGESLAHPVRHALVNAYAFGGNNISMVLGSAAAPGGPA